MINKILIPIDFQKHSLLALEESFILARLINAEIVLMYVHEQAGFLASLFSNDQHSEMLSKIDEKLAELAGTAAIKSGIKVSYRLEKGRIYSKIIEVAKEIRAKYIIIGTHSTDESERTERHLGANTSKVVRLAGCPVITISTKPVFNGCRTILLPLDLTKETSQKVNLCIEKAKMYGAGIKVVSALWTNNNPELPGKLNKKGSQVLDYIKAAGIDCTFGIVESNDEDRTLVPAILDYASRQGDIDLIIIFTQQEIGIVEYFVGSHAQEFIRLSDIPVMSIIPKDPGFNSIFQ